MQQITQLRSQMKEYEQSVQELEATKEQLEEDTFSTHNALQQMEKQTTQVYTELTYVFLHTRVLCTWKDEHCSYFSTCIC